MEVFTTIAQVREFVGAQRRAGRSIGFVPTMGALHEGHLSLMRRAREECDVVVISIFVNPTQFGPGEDFDRYPRDLEGDCRKARSVGVDAVFAPGAAEMYPQGFATFVEQEGHLVSCLEGRFRPGHFRGVLTVCLKLFEIVAPDRAYFGQKDYQQALVVGRMVRDLNLPLELVVCPTVREPDGLAMSSRNAYLSQDERTRALSLSRGLRAAQDALARGERDARRLEAIVRAEIEAAEPSAIDYVAVADAETLEPVETVDRRCVAAVAVRFGQTRLIDNCLLEP